MVSLRHAAKLARTGISQRRQSIHISMNHSMVGVSRYDPPSSLSWGVDSQGIPYRGCLGIGSTARGSRLWFSRGKRVQAGHRPHSGGSACSNLRIKSSTWNSSLVKNIIGAAQPNPPPEVQFLVVDEESDGQRLDNWLMRHLKGAPKTLIYRIIRSGEVRVNKGRASADTRVATGDQVRVPPLRLAAKPPAAVSGVAGLPAAPARQFPVLYEDDGILAIDKPAGVAVHGGSGISHGVIELLRQARPGAPMLELVHRLDRETSGVLLVAKKRSALTRLQEQFRQRETGKTYLTLVPGQWPSRQKVIDMPLQRYLVPNGQGEGERRVRVVGKDDPDGQRAITLVRVARLVGGFSLLEVTIKTGRTHQIRVHLSSLGYPIVGDDKYGNFERNREWHKAGLQRMFLHAWRLQFIHPQTLRPVNLESPLPPELQAFIDHVQPPPAPL